MKPLSHLASRHARLLGALAFLSCLAPGCSGDDPQAPASAAGAGQAGAGLAGASAAGSAGSTQGAGQAGAGPGGAAGSQGGEAQGGAGQGGDSQGGAGGEAQGGEAQGGEAGQGGEPGGEGGAGQGGSAGAGAGSGGGASAKSLGFAVIDVQDTFVKGSVTPDMAGVLARTKSDFEQAAQLSTPFFITYEASKKGDHALDKSLVPVIPPQAKIIKTTFAATGLPSFAKAIQQPGLSHVVVLGSETDVCVLQTVLGLRKMGFSVLLQQDAVFTSESRPSPALRRMQRVGVVLVDQQAVTGYLADPSTLPDVAPVEVKTLDPLHVGVVLQGFTDEAVKASADPWLSQKSARLRELLLVSEWFELPVYVDDPSAGLPAAFSTFFKGQLRPLSQLALDASVTQVVVAGTDEGLTPALASLGQKHQLFLAEDAVLAKGTHAALLESLGPSFEGGLVPLTYKTFYYEMTQSVSTAQWPSKKWVDRFETYYWLTKAPEDLPPLPAD